ncbi:MAG: 30S ribosomal protein S4 [Planctomycetota bacterium]
MARYTGNVCKLCRREGAKLYLKGTRCDSPKCSISRREYPPGAHTWRRGKPSAYSFQLREKQRVKRYYGVLERQFRKTFAEAERLPGNTGENLLVLLERRLDNVVLNLGFAKSRYDARQMVVHGHIQVNGHKVDKPSAQLRAGDEITSREREKSKKMVKENLEYNESRRVPSWLEVDNQKPLGRVIQFPNREDIGTTDREIDFREQLIVELLSK